MPRHELHLDIAWLALEQTACLAATPLLPELSELGGSPTRMRERLERNAAKRLADEPLARLHRRLLAKAPEATEMTVSVTPPERTDAPWRSRAWQETVPLRFHYLLWQHGPHAVVAYVPALDIEVVCPKEDDLPESLEREILFALRREELASSLEELCQLDRYTEIRVERRPIYVDLKTPKQVAQGDEHQEKRVLPQVATNLRLADASDVFQMEPSLSRLAEYLSGAQRQSVLLVGPSGVGKTALVGELARRRAKYGLAGAPFWTTSGARLVAGMVGFSMWQEQCQALCREAHKTKAVIHLGNLVELMHVGKCSASDQGVADFLRPSIERGELQAIAECTPEQQTILQRDMPGLLGAFAQLEVKPPSVETGNRILELAARKWSPPRDLTLTNDALRTLARLHRRYATYSAFPGLPLRFLRNLLETTGQGSTVTSATVNEAFSRQTGLPRIFLDENQPLDLQATHDWLSSRVIGQPAAVDVVVDLLASVKADLNRADRPIASLMFIGPTGVGKTEMAKSLAEFLFQDRRRMIRIDMSEYADPVAVERLIGGTSQEGVLTSRVREQPFGIVLLDEFEKAHPRLFDLLLQVLGEGRLGDARGRLADFRSTVVVMTSNLGSESFGKEQLGFQDASDGAAAPQHFLRAVERHVRPEFFNRIDRVVPFLPLANDVLHAIARRELSELDRREGILHRQLELEFSDGLVEEIVRRGEDRRYGARPIKRAIERHVLAPLAKAVNEYPAEVPLRASLDADNDGVQVAVKALAERKGGEPMGLRRKAASLARAACLLRREVFQLRQSRVLIGLRNRLHHQESIQSRQSKKERRLAAKGRPLPPPVPALLAEIETLQGQLRKINDLAEGVAELEECVLTEFYAGRWQAAMELESELEGFQSSLDSTCLELFARDDPSPNRVTLVVYCRKDRPMFDLCRAYVELAKGRRWEVTLNLIVPRFEPAADDDRWFRLGDRRSTDEALVKQANGTYLMARKEPQLQTYLAEPVTGVVGLGLEIAGPQAGLLLEPEDGLHTLVRPGGRAECLVDTSRADMVDYRPPAKVDTTAGVGKREIRRIYQAESEYIDDKRLTRRQHWKGKQLAAAIEPLVDEYLMARAKEWIHAD